MTATGRWGLIGDMALRTHLGCLSAVALLSLALAGCKDKGAATKSEPTAADLDRRCEQLSMSCGDKDKHVEKMLDQCKAAAKKQLDGKCGAKAIAAYDCYEKELCGSGDKVWSVDDLRVLAERHKKCVAESKALAECAKK